MKKTILGKKVVITNTDSIYYDEWGTVIGQIDNEYFISIADDKNSSPVFNRDEFRVTKN